MTSPLSLVGTPVHYVRNSSGGPDYPRLCRAALVTEIFAGSYRDSEPDVNLVVFDPDGFRNHHEVAYVWKTDGPDYPGTWHRLEDHACSRKAR